MTTLINSSVTRTPFLSKGSLETRLLTVSLASAIISGDMGKNWDSAMVCVVSDCCHASRIKNRIWEQRIFSSSVAFKGLIKKIIFGTCNVE
jgi:hypothetical protein